MASRKIRLVAVNALVLLLILWTTNTCSSLVLDLQAVLEPRLEGEDPRAALPNYRGSPGGREKASQVYREFDALRTEYAAFHGWSRLPFESRYTNIGPAGDRIHPRPASLPADAPVVRFFGGSAMWGTGSADDETIPARFQALAPDLAVHNHGEAAFVSRQSLARLISLANRGAPMDLVVFYDGFNDVFTLCRFGIAVQGHSRERQIREALLPRSALLHALTGSTVALLEPLLPEESRPAGTLSGCHAEPERHAEVVATLLGNWRVAREVARLAGAEFAAVLQPVAATSQGPTGHLTEDDAFLGRAHTLVYPTLRRAIAAADEPWMFDRSALFDRDEIVFVDATHVSPNGNRLMAQEMAALLGPALARIRAGEAPPHP